MVLGFVTDLSYSGAIVDSLPPADSTCSAIQSLKPGMLLLSINGKSAVELALDEVRQFYIVDTPQCFFFVIAALLYLIHIIVCVVSIPFFC